MSGTRVYGCSDDLIEFQGELFEYISDCNSTDGTAPDTDVAHFKPGITWAYAATEWEKVK